MPADRQQRDEAAAASASVNRTPGAFATPGAAAHASTRSLRRVPNDPVSHFSLCDLRRGGSRSPTFSFNSLCVRRSATASLS